MHFRAPCSLVAQETSRLDTLPQTPARFMLDQSIAADEEPSMDWGLRNRISRILRPEDGRTVMLAVDHGYFLGPTHRLEKPAATIAPLLPYADAFFDAVVTDPPYYDAVPYSDLSDFFYVWLKRTVGPLYPGLFDTPLAPRGPEIIQDSSLLRRAAVRTGSSIKDRDFFEREMAKAFREMHRVLKPEGTCAVVFAHKTTTAWETLIGALLDAGFAVSASWPTARLADCPPPLKAM